MGVPKFYRWLSERYPCLSEVITDAQIPEFDNLYLDMNGIIHNCSHPNDDDITFRISEEQIFQDIFKYIENLFNIIKPQKVFFMAVDGVAPRAKMNQQRARRFMSAKNADDLLEKAKKAGEEIPSEKRFDSNCITPGTQFMVELQRRLDEWVQHKVNTDGRWRGMRIYLSGHNCPGEGEHKIMDFIRAERASEGYDPNTRHCMYGLDADLIMLGMCSHEPHFSLLREEVKFSRPARPGKKKGAPPPKKTDADSICFHLLHLSILREYLAWEFIKVKEAISFEYDMERIIDDWVLMGFLIGNDFIPHLPNVHIHDDALPLLYSTYMDVLPTLDGYINENGHLNLKRFQEFLKAFSRNDRNSFLQVMEDEEYLASKMGTTGIDDDIEGTLVQFHDSDMSTASDEEESGNSGDGEAAFQSSDSEEESSSAPPSSRGGPSQGVLADGGIGGAADLLAQLQADPVEDEFAEQLAALQFRDMDDAEFQNNVDNCWTRSINNDFKRHKKRYYSEKLKMGNISKGQLKEQAEGYVRAIQWNLHYYYHGCCSWNWYFRHHYAPYISDVIDFSTMEMGFEMSQPFLPFEQLLAVLPAASSECLPRPLRELMCNGESTIADFYPTDFRTDLNGKKNDWEAVVLIPFIDEKRLLEAIHEKEVLLSAEDRARNSHGPHLLFTANTQPVNGNWCSREPIDKNAFRIPMEKVVHGLLPNVKLDVFFPGFPTIKHLPHSGELRDVHVRVFNMPSRKLSMVLSILDRPDLSREVEAISADLLGEEVCIDWPVLKVGLVEEIWTEDVCYKRCYDEQTREAIKGKVITEKLDEEQKKSYALWRRDAGDRLMERYAIASGPVKAMARVRRLLGTSMVVEGDKVVPRRQWTPSDIAVPVPLQLVCVGVLVNESISRVPLSIKDAFPIDTKVFVMDPAWSGYGYPALVKEIADEGTPNCRLTVQYALPTQDMDLRAIRSEPAKFSLQWCDGYSTLRQTGVDRGLIARLTGTVFIMDCTQEEMEKDGSYRPPKLNVGLNLKLSKRNEETPDYAKRTPEGYWIYSILTVRALIEYKNRFPEIFKFLEKNNSVEDNYYSGDIWPQEETRKGRVAELREWLEGLPSFNEQKQRGGEEYADRMAVAHVESILAGTNRNCVFRKSMVRPALIYRPSLNAGSKRVRPDPDANFLLFDRVTFAQDNQNVPFGLTGTVIGLHGTDHVDVLFDKEFPTGIKIRSSLPSCARVLVSALVNTTFAKERKTSGFMRPPVPKQRDAPSSSTTQPGKSAWEDRSKKGEENRGKDKKDRKESGGSKGKEKEGPPPTVLKLLKNTSAAKTVAGISVNDNQKRSKAEKTAEAQQLLDMLIGAAPPPAANKKADSSKKEEGKKTTKDEKGEETEEERNKKGAEAGAALLASLQSTPTSKTMSSVTMKKEKTETGSVVSVQSTPSTSRKERPPNRKERRAIEREKKLQQQTTMTSSSKKETNKELKPRPKTPPVTSDVFALLGVSPPEMEKKEEMRERKETIAVREKENEKEIEPPSPSPPLQQSQKQQGAPRGGRAQNQFWGPSSNNQRRGGQSLQQTRPAMGSGGGYGRPGLPPLNVMSGGGGGRTYGAPPPGMPSPQDVMMAVAHQVVHGAPPHLQQQFVPLSAPQQHPFHQQQQPMMMNNHRGGNNGRGGGRRGRGGGRETMKPEEYVRDKVTDLMPSSVRGFGKGRGGQRGGGQRGGTRTVHSVRSPSEKIESAHPSEVPSAPPTTAAAAAAATKQQQKARKPRIAMKLNAQTE
ncbi:hypothetical protein PMAYCL1PPCAC_06053 [Pristionchus mayeri]|uniref:Uncharacterized protein n=1 Tax=Pristionchus mayeri TaxID=1317129 RepID=A0AAN4Z7J0_9BILA|nr:hypothetical protein PMAYCL1PPCAC_06053 [Pristionchus mayeri]